MRPRAPCGKPPETQPPETQPPETQLPETQLLDAKSSESLPSHTTRASIQLPTLITRALQGQKLRTVVIQYVMFCWTSLGRPSHTSAATSTGVTVAGSRCHPYGALTPPSPRTSAPIITPGAPLARRARIAAAAVVLDACTLNVSFATWMVKTVPMLPGGTATASAPLHATMKASDICMIATRISDCRCEKSLDISRSDRGISIATQSRSELVNRRRLETLTRNNTPLVFVCALSLSLYCGHVVRS